MQRDMFRYAIELIAGDRALGWTPVSPDWEPALEAATFDGIRRSRVPIHGGRGMKRIEPVWDGSQGPPFVSAFRAVVSAPDGEDRSCEIPIAYLRPLAQQASADFVSRGELQAGQAFHYRVGAFAVDGAVAAVTADEFSLEEVARSLNCDEARLSHFVEESSAVHASVEAPGDIAAFVAPRVLEEAEEQARRAGPIETGGILVGRLHHDVGISDLFVEITAQIPARHTVASATKLTFTAETWAAARAAIALRGDDELMLGFWHFHPDWCAKCPPENRGRCPLGDNAFFSADDVHVQRVCFPRAYQVALLVSEKVDAGLTWAMFGWRRGSVEARAFRVLSDGPGGGEVS